MHAWSERQQLRLHRLVVQHGELEVTRRLELHVATWARRREEVAWIRDRDPDLTPPVEMFAGKLWSKLGRELAGVPMVESAMRRRRRLIDARREYDAEAAKKHKDPLGWE